MSSKSDPDPAPAATPRARRTWSLAARLTVWYAGSACLVVLAVAGCLYWALVTNLDWEDNNALAEKVQALRRVLRQRPGEAAAVHREAAWAWAASEYAQVYMRILDPEGRVVAETPGMSPALRSEVFPVPIPTDAEPGEGSDLRAADGRAFLVLAARVDPGTPGQPAWVLQVALDRTHEEDLLARFRRTLWLLLGLAFLACAVGGYRIARRGTRPVREITRTARCIRATTLGERLTVAKLPEELADLADTFNDMLDRLEEAFARLARFSADIAHELRTPLATLRGQAEVALRQPRSAGEYRDVLGSCLEECARLTRLIDGLLFLARAENPRTQVERETVEVGRELTAVREFYEAKAADAGVRLEVSAPEGLVASLDRLLLQRALVNLVDNALTHTPEGGTVTLSATRKDGQLCVEVTDTGKGIPETHLPHLFDRFYRVDRARSSATGGVGLGLAIVKGIAELHGGSVALTSAAGRGTRVTLCFPIPSPRQDGACGREQPKLTKSSA